MQRSWEVSVPLHLAPTSVSQSLALASLMPMMDLRRVRIIRTLHDGHCIWKDLLVVTSLGL